MKAFLLIRLELSEAHIHHIFVLSKYISYRKGAPRHILLFVSYHHHQLVTCMKGGHWGLGVPTYLHVIQPVLEGVPQILNLLPDLGFMAEEHLEDIGFLRDTSEK